MSDVEEVVTSEGIKYYRCHAMPARSAPFAALWKATDKARLDDKRRLGQRNRELVRLTPANPSEGPIRLLPQDYFIDFFSPDYFNACSAANQRRLAGPEENARVALHPDLVVEHAFGPPLSKLFKSTEKQLVGEPRDRIMSSYQYHDGDDGDDENGSDDDRMRGSQSGSNRDNVDDEEEAPDDEEFIDAELAKRKTQFATLASRVMNRYLVA
jgi:hypothetical protein